VVQLALVDFYSCKLPALTIGLDHELISSHSLLCDHHSVGLMGFGLNLAHPKYLDILSAIVTCSFGALLALIYCAVRSSLPFSLPFPFFCPFSSILLVRSQSPVAKSFPKANAEGNITSGNESEIFPGPSRWSLKVCDIVRWDCYAAVDR
jgi:hypothetical protein